MNNLTELSRVLSALRLDLDGADETHASKLPAFFDQLYGKVVQAERLVKAMDAAADLHTTGDRYTASVGPEPVEMDGVQ